MGFEISASCELGQRSTTCASGSWSCVRINCLSTQDDNVLEIRRGFTFVKNERFRFLGKMPKSSSTESATY